MTVIYILAEVWPDLYVRYEKKYRILDDMRIAHQFDMTCLEKFQFEKNYFLNQGINFF